MSHSFAIGFLKVAKGGIEIYLLPKMCETKHRKHCVQSMEHYGYLQYPSCFIVHIVQ